MPLAAEDKSHGCQAGQRARRRFRHGGGRAVGGQEEGGLLAVEETRANDLAEVERRYREGGIGYGEMKNRLAESLIAHFAEARERRADWVAHPERVARVRAEAAERARAVARIVLAKARAACGVA